MQFAAPAMSDEECVARLAEGYRQSFDDGCLITWGEMERRLDTLYRIVLTPQMASGIEEAIE
ncbi:MAG: hypothetical protein LBR44_01200 [Clostridiales Family XIII bacterium]|jgi:hypothetical protein|nr:hypothetical protein [Clostridiales Family XIII bacterium]